MALPEFHGPDGSLTQANEPCSVEKVDVGKASPASISLKNYKIRVGMTISQTFMGAMMGLS